MSALAEGPVSPGGIPFGVNVVDTDGGEAWGRAGGRNITYTVNDPTAFDWITWGAVGADAVQLAFDNSIDAPGETLVLDTNISNLPGGVAIWAGQATLPLSGGGALNLNTRFTLTVVDASSNPIPMDSVPGGNMPGVNAIFPGGAFTANLLFEAQYNGNWVPALDLFDALSTIPGNPPGQGGPVLTSFTSGFFFEIATGLSIEEHDQNMLSQTDMIKDDLGSLDGKIDFLTTDAINRLQQLGGDHSDLINGLHQVLGALQNLPNIPNDLPTSQQVSQVREEIQNMLLILFGLFPCPPEAGPLCDSATFINDLATQEELALVKSDLQTLLDKVMDIQNTLNLPEEGKEVRIQVVEVSRGSTMHWLLTTTVEGELVDVDLNRVLAITVKKSSAVNDVTSSAVATRLSTGLLDVGLEVPRKGKKAGAYQLDVAFADGASFGQGSLLVSSKSRGKDDD